MQLMAGLNNERLIIAAQSLGMAQRAFDDVLAYVKERKQFGRPIGSFQALKHRLADLATEIEATRLLVYDVRRARRRQPRRAVPARGLDGQAQGHRDGQAHRARGRCR